MALFVVSDYGFGIYYRPNEKIPEGLRNLNLGFS
ncbi:MAG: hypothetical protein ACI9Z7_001156, partial [Alteromonas macleodii]